MEGSGDAVVAVRVTCDDEDDDNRIAGLASSLFDGLTVCLVDCYSARIVVRYGGNMKLPRCRSCRIFSIAAALQGSNTRESTPLEVWQRKLFSRLMDVSGELVVA